MRVLVAPQEFKGSLTAAQAAAAMALGVRDALGAAADAIEAPLSDGGPGFVDAMLAAAGGVRLRACCHDPRMRPVEAAFGVLPDGTAAIEMAAASGLVMVPPDELDPLRATTFGTGELIRAAMDHGCRSIIVGVGGSATVDGGAGALQALGARLLAGGDRELAPGGGALRDLARIDAGGLDERLKDTRLRLASDVRNPLLGEAGAARMFGPQKGASAADVALLEAALARFAEVLLRETGVDVRTMEGGGAAGGLGAGLVALAGATIEPGFELVAEAVGLRAKVAAADVVLTGEGRLDAQTAFGKTVAGVARLARESGKRVGVAAGSVADGGADGGVFDAVEALAGASMPVAEAMRQAEPLLRAAATRLVTRLATAG